MSVRNSIQKQRRMKRLTGILTVLLVILIAVGATAAVAVTSAKRQARRTEEERKAAEAAQNGQSASTEQESAGESTDGGTEAASGEKAWLTGYMAGEENEVYLQDESGELRYAVIRGTQVEYSICTDGRYLVRIGDVEGYCLPNAVMDNQQNVVPECMLYVRTGVNLRTEDGKLLEYLVNKGDTVSVEGCDRICEDGSVHMYKVVADGNEGYIMPWYLTDSYESAIANYSEEGLYRIHADREDYYGGGNGGNLDYYPREKGDFADLGNVMPEEVKALYITVEAAANIDDYITVADACGINTFIFDIEDGGSVAFPSESMEYYSPATYGSAFYTAEQYAGYVQKAKDAGYYVVGRITTFTDYNLVYDHPECAVLDETGEPKYLNGGYWPSGFSRLVWEFKVAMAVDAVNMIGFNEIQFDYVRFPDLTWEYEQNGTIDYQNTYGETKAQAIQRFLMYATDILHEYGVYVGADVFGESAYNYITAYGQYWPAISNVADVISGMPYPDHFSSYSGYLPWEHPYDVLYEWGTYVATRQTEIPTPAAVRTWIQCYDAIKEPYNEYGVAEIEAQVKGLRDAGCTGGYMTWNGSSDLYKYASLEEAFDY